MNAGRQPMVSNNQDEIDELGNREQMRGRVRQAG